MVYWGVTHQKQPGSYRGGDDEMKCQFHWWRTPEYPEETTDLQGSRGQSNVAVRSNTVEVTYLPSRRRGLSMYRCTKNPLVSKLISEIDRVYVDPLNPYIEASPQECVCRCVAGCVGCVCVFMCVCVCVCVCVCEEAMLYTRLLPGL